VEFRIDEENMTVELVDEYFGWPELPAFDAEGKSRSFNSDVQWLPNGHVVISQSINAVGLLGRGVPGKAASGFVAEVDWETKELELLYRIGAETGGSQGKVRSEKTQLEHRAVAPSGKIVLRQGRRRCRRTGPGQVEQGSSETRAWHDTSQLSSLTFQVRPSFDPIRGNAVRGISR